MDELIRRLRNHAWVTNEVADLLEKGDVEMAESLAALSGLAYELMRERITIDGKEAIIHEHRVAVERRTA